MNGLNYFVIDISWGMIVKAGAMTLYFKFTIIKKKKAVKLVCAYSEKKKKGSINKPQQEPTTLE